jgi:hypothetical protein
VTRLADRFVCEDPPPKPLAFRAVFAFSSTGAVLYSQRFCSVEVGVPPNDAIAAVVRSEVIPLLATTQSVFSLGESMPLVVIPARSLVLGVVPLVESGAVPHVEISASFSFLTFLEAITRASLKAVAADSRGSGSL